MRTRCDLHLVNSFCEFDLPVSQPDTVKLEARAPPRNINHIDPIIKDKELRITPVVQLVELEFALQRLLNGLGPEVAVRDGQVNHRISCLASVSTVTAEHALIVIVIAELL